jgi:hypothetical protein
MCLIKHAQTLISQSVHCQSHHWGMPRLGTAAWLLTSSLDADITAQWLDDGSYRWTGSGWEQVVTGSLYRRLKSDQLGLVLKAPRCFLQLVSASHTHAVTPSLCLGLPDIPCLFPVSFLKRLCLGSRGSSCTFQSHFACHFWASIGSDVAQIMGPSKPRIRP